MAALETLSQTYRITHFLCVFLSLKLAITYRHPHERHIAKNLLNNNFPTRIGKMLGYKNDKWQTQAGGWATSKCPLRVARTFRGTHMCGNNETSATYLQKCHLFVNNFNELCQGNTHTLTHKIICTPHIYMSICSRMLRLFGWLKLP